MSLPAGWNIDREGWFWRRSRPGDPKIGQRSDIGYDDSTFPESPPEGRVYVRIEEDCLTIDQGRLREVSS